MPRVRLSRRARADLLAIWSHVARREPRAADRLYDVIARRCAELSEFPLLGPARADIRPGARCLRIKRWLLIYTVHGDTVRLERVVDAARDVRNLTFSE